MIIHLVRHAEAIDRSEEIPEEHRFLTYRGRSRFRKVASSLRKKGVEPDLILTSPFTRTVQTAEILAQTVKHGGALLVTALLAPGFRPEQLDTLLSRYPQAKEIALVGHEPDLGALARALLAEEATCTLKKGAVITFRITAEQGDTTKFIRLIGAGGKIITSRKKALERLMLG